MRKILILFLFAIGLVGCSQSDEPQNSLGELVLLGIPDTGNKVRQADLYKSRIYFKFNDNDIRPIEKDDSVIITIINNSSVYHFNGPKIPSSIIKTINQFPGAKFQLKRIQLNGSTVYSPIYTVLASRTNRDVKYNQLNEENMIKEIDELKEVDISFNNRQGDPDRGVALSLLDDTGNGDKDINDDGEDDGSFMSVEQMPRFPGGDEALNEWLLKNTPYPAEARENGIDGTVIVQFTVDRTGGIKDAHVVRKVHPLLDDAAMTAIKKMPNWSAGKQNGKAVSVLINLPFRFGIKE